MSLVTPAIRCAECGEGGLFIGSSTICEGCLSCPTCRGLREIDLPDGPDDSALRACPTCQPGAWHRGFPGLKAHGRWIIEPTGEHAGRTP